MRPLLLTLAATLTVATVASADPIKIVPSKQLQPNPRLVPTGTGSVVPLPYWNPNGPLKVAFHPQPQPNLFSNVNRVFLNPQPLPPRWNR